MDAELDLRGLNCPLPVVKTKKALDGIEEGDIVVIVESPEGCQNVQRFAESQGCKVSVKEREGLFRLHIRKEKTEKAVAPAQSKDVIMITTDRFGSGDDELGAILMKAFLYTLWDVERKPAKILLINDGVRLATENKETIDSLKLLEEAGVEIFSCGTCLDYYQLKDKLGVGQATNMYDTVDSLLSAGKVIKI